MILGLIIHLICFSVWSQECNHQWLWISMNFIGKFLNSKLHVFSTGRHLIQRLWQRIAIRFLWHLSWARNQLKQLKNRSLWFFDSISICKSLVYWLEGIYLKLVSMICLKSQTFNFSHKFSLSSRFSFWNKKAIEYWQEIYHLYIFLIHKDRNMNTVSFPFVGKTYLSGFESPDCTCFLLRQIFFICRWCFYLWILDTKFKNIITLLSILLQLIAFFLFFNIERLPFFLLPYFRLLEPLFSTMHSLNLTNPGRLS